MALPPAGAHTVHPVTDVDVAVGPGFCAFTFLLSGHPLAVIAVTFNPGKDAASFGCPTLPFAIVSVTFDGDGRRERGGRES